MWGGAELSEAPWSKAPLPAAPITLQRRDRRGAGMGCPDRAKRAPGPAPSVLPNPGPQGQRGDDSFGSEL